MSNKNARCNNTFEPIDDSLSQRTAGACSWRPSCVRPKGIAGICRIPDLGHCVSFGSSPLRFKP